MILLNGGFCPLVELHREGSAPAACAAGLFPEIQEEKQVMILPGSFCHFFLNFSFLFRHFPLHTAVQCSDVTPINCCRFAKQKTLASTARNFFQIRSHKRGARIQESLKISSQIMPETLFLGIKSRPENSSLIGYCKNITFNVRNNGIPRTFLVLIWLNYLNIR